MRSHALLMSLLAAGVVLAGCSDGDKAPADDTDFSEIPPLVATPDTGIIRGVVFDSAITPVSGATVKATGPGDATVEGTTSESGLFGFDGLAPGTWFVEASKAGFLTGRQEAQVQANVAEPDLVKILIERDPATTPYIQAFVFEGFLECNVSIVIVRFAACSGVGNDHFLEEYTLDQPPDWIQSEMVWESTQALGEEMQLSITDFSTDLQTRVNASAGPSPQYITVNKTTAAEFRFGVNNTVVLRVFNDAVDETDVWPDEEAQEAYGSTVWPVYNASAPQPVKDQAFFLQECVMYPVLFDACLGMGGVGVTFQQAFTIYTHVFYHFEPTPGWRFSEDGEHPVPL